MVMKTERVTGRKARGLQVEKGGCRCQTFLSLLAAGRNKPAICFLLCINLKESFTQHAVWSHLKLTTLKPRVNQYISFSYENVILSYVNEPQTLSSSWFRKTA